MENNLEMNNLESPRIPAGVTETTKRGPVLIMQLGLFQFGEQRALDSGAVEVVPEDLHALQQHAKAIARETHCERYDPSTNSHDALLQAEYEKHLVDRREAELAERHAVSHAADASARYAATPKAGPQPSIRPLTVVSFISVIGSSQQVADLNRQE